MRSRVGVSGLVVALASLGGAVAAQPVSHPAADGVTVHGERYFGNLAADAPLILLFHQGGGDGRGEYAPLATWLNAEGFRAIAWDQRRGGSRFSMSNRTVAGLSEGAEYSYCDAYPDLEAALDYVLEHRLADRVVAWGSSYSATLVMRLAAENPGTVSGVLSFSPASGDAMEGCQPEPWAGDVQVPMFALRPASEMELAGPIQQRDRLEGIGVRFHVVEHGVHGSSMLVDERTGVDMSADRALVLDWLRALPRPGSPPPTPSLGGEVTR